ncbi:MAG: GNAT family N-acetyltransferase [Provencibacterium sp.]|nr:GNAT family N-acetyltransferase [Provencibacterium sp.]
MERFMETERLILRPLTGEDAKDVFEWTGDPAVNRYMPYPLYQNIRQVSEWIAGIRPEDNEFGFFLKAAGKVIGAGSICYCQKRKAYNLGYNLNRAFWGNGYATEAAKALIDWAYHTLGARDFTANHANANTASKRVIQKCGFVFERCGQYSRFDGSETFDASYYTLHLD